MVDQEATVDADPWTDRDDLVRLGSVDDAVLLLAGDEPFEPTPFWTPRLVGTPPEEVARQLDEARRELRELGLLVDGQPAAWFGEVAAVVRAAEAVVTFEVDDGDDVLRGAFVPDGGRVLLVMGHEAGHNLFLASAEAALEVLLDLLVPFGVDGVGGDPRPVSLDELPDVVAEHHVTTRVVQAGRGHDGEEVMGMVSVHTGAPDPVAVWPSPEHGAVVQQLGFRDAYGLASALLGIEWPAASSGAR